MNFYISALQIPTFTQIPSFFSPAKHRVIEMLNGENSLWWEFFFMHFYVIYQLSYIKNFYHYFYT